MKKWILHLLFLLIGFAVVITPSAKVSAQNFEEELRSEKYARAIGRIVDQSGGKISREDIIRYLSNSEKSKLNGNPSPHLLSGELIITPTIDVVSYDGNDSARFSFLPLGATTHTLVFPENPGWINDWKITNDSIKIGVDTNLTNEARLAEFIDTAFIETAQRELDTLIGSSWILQEPQPEKIIYVSPTYYAVPPEGDTTDNFIITYFNIDTWEAEIQDEDKTWISKADSTHNGSPDSISFYVEANLGSASREADIEIRDSDNPTIKDIIHIYQYGSQQQYLIASPKENFATPDKDTIQIIVFSNVAWNAAAINPPEGMIFNLPVSSTGYDTLNIIVAQNTTPDSREAQVEISNESSNLSEAITIYQSAAFILLNPREQVVACEGDVFDVEIIKFGVNEVEVTQPVWFELPPIVSGNLMTITVPENPTLSSRFGYVVVSSSTYSLIRDSILVAQYSCSQPYILLSPREQIANWDDTSLETPFEVNSNNIAQLLLQDDADWLTANFNGDSTSVLVTLQENQSTEIRTSEIKVFDTSNLSFYDSVRVVQQGKQTYILIDPSFQSVSYQGGATDLFSVDSLNVDDWELVTAGLPTWISDYQITNEGVVFEIAQNTATSPRQTTFFIRDTDYPLILDSAIIFQEAAPAPYLFCSPREQHVAHTGNPTVDFTVTKVNVASWEFADTLTTSDWIDFLNIGDSILRLSIDTNFLLQTRQAGIIIRATNDTLVTDTVSIYQYSSLDEYLLAAPREQKVFYTESIINFDVTVVNIEQPWETEIISGNEWVQVLVSGNDSLQLKVSKNDSIQSRTAKVRIYAPGNPDVADTVTIYQFAAPDLFLIAEPREQKVAHFGNEAVDFDITRVNLTSWDFGDTTAYGEWIDFQNQGDSVLRLVVDTNTLLESRQAKIPIVATDHPWVTDTVSIFQYSSLDEYLLAAPREQEVFYTETIIHFNITVVNIDEPWETEILSGNEWVQVLVSGDASLQLKVSKNDSIQSRTAKVRIFAPSNQAVADTVTIYQFAAPDLFLLAEPREQKVAHFGNETVDFDITRVNLTSWDFGDTTAYGEWIDFQNLGDSVLRLVVDTNTLLESRQAKIPIVATDHPWVTDTVSIFQYSSLDEYLLAAPREQEVFYTDTIIHFDITVVNIDELWETEILSGNEWVQVLVSGDDLLQLEIAENDTLLARIATIRISASGFEGVADTVSVYQFSAPDPFLLLSPREQWVVHTGNANLDFQVTAVNVEFLEANAGNNDWITVNTISPDLLSLNIAENATPGTRVGTVVVSDVSNAAIFDSVMVYQYSALDSFLLASPREKLVEFTGDNISFHITSANVPGWVVDPGSLPYWIQLGTNNDDTLKLIISMNPTLQTRSFIVYLYDPDNPQTEDSVAVYQYATIDPYILLAPREQKVSHLGNTTVDFNVTLVNVDEWEFADTTAYQEWIDFQNLGDTMRLSIDPNNLLEARYANIVIHSAENPDFRDSVNIYQYSGLDNYILLEPREQMAKRYSGDTLYFKSTRVNVEELGFEVFDENEMIDLEYTSITNDTLAVYVNLNTSPDSRQAMIKVFDADHPDEVYDSVFVYQNFPYIIYRPAAIDSLEWVGAVRKIDTWSNVAQYTVDKEEAYDWIQISRDSVGWSSQSLMLEGNDKFYLRVDSNNNSYLRRSSLLKFKISDEIATELWFDQNTRPGVFFPVSGQVFIQNDPFQALAGVSVVLYDSILKTNQVGNYEYKMVPENWIGTITPLIDTSWDIPYYFLPPRIEISGLGIIDTTRVDPFAAYKIDPAVTLSLEETAICFGETLMPGDPNYPAANITDTYGSSEYLWIADPPDSLLSINPDSLTPEFRPKVNTTYRLEVYNFFRIAVDSFTIIVNQLPETTGFDGVLSVCKNQAGVIYQVPNPQPGVYYQWRLDPENPGGVFANSSLPYAVSGNIAIVNWGDNPGNFTLQLIAFNEFDCPADPVSKTIEISNTEAPPPTTVQRKDNDNMLFCSDTLAKSYQWGWFQKNAAGELVQEYIIPGKTDWYCRLPDNHTFNPVDYYYFVLAFYDENSCGSRSFYNAPVGMDELTEQGITVFPNPGNGIFTIRFGSEMNIRGGVIEVYNVTGKLIYQQKLVATRNEETINLMGDRIPDPGIYLLVVRTAEFLINSKIVIQ